MRLLAALTCCYISPRVTVADRSVPRLMGEWIDPRRGHVPLSAVAADWLGSRSSVKRRTRESDESAWRELHRSAFRQLAGGLNHGGRGVGLGRLTSSRGPGSIDGDSCPGHAALRPCVRGG